MSSPKIATTQYKVLDTIRNRWSARSFAPDTLTEEDVLTLLEAASWAPSSNNSQPWRFVYALRDSEAFNTILGTLSTGNATWAKNAAALIVSVGIRELPDTEQKNIYYMHDTGMANSFLVMQAHSMNIYAHVMGGFSKPQIAAALRLDPHEEPVVVIALGFKDDASKLEEPFKTRETTPRTRKTLSEIAKKLD